MAFCFYNLSSIVNGLVYFDQFSMLSTTHLLLVLLGIAVLLAGVYVISFPPEGSRGIDIGTWTEGEPPRELLSTGESDVEAQDEVFEDEPLPMEDEVRPASPRNRTQTQIGLGLQIIMEPPTPIPAPQVSPAPPSPAGLSSRSRACRHAREQTDSALLASPPRRSRSSADELHHLMASDTHSGATTGRRRGRTTVEPSSSLSPGALITQRPLSPSGSALGGFSIGLSPLSPGFSIVPKERRRRTTPLSVSGSGSGLGLGLSNSIHGSFGAAGASLAASSASPGTGADGHSHQDTQGRFGHGARLPPRAASWKMRRVVSEGDAERERRRAAPAGQEGSLHGTDRDLERDAASGEGEGEGETQESDDGTREHQAYSRGDRRAKGRWKWLQTVVERIVRGGGAEESR